MLIKILLLSIAVWFGIGAAHYIFVVLCKSGKEVTQDYTIKEHFLLMLVSVVTGPTAPIAAFVSFCKRRISKKNQ